MRTTEVPAAQFSVLCLFAAPYARQHEPVGAAEWKGKGDWPVGRSTPSLRVSLKTGAVGVGIGCAAAGTEKRIA